MAKQLLKKDSEEVRRLKELVVTSARILDNEHIYDYVGHVSARIPGTETMLITPHLRELSFAELTWRDIQTMDFKGNHIDPTIRHPQEFWIHSCIYEARPDVNSVVHIHPEYCVAFSIAEVPIQPFYVTGNVFIKGVPLFKEPSLIISEKLGDDLAKTLGDSQAALCKWHGAVTVGASVQEACITMVTLEQAARIQYRAMALAGGKKLDPLPASSHIMTPEFIHSAAGWKYFESRLPK